MKNIKDILLSEAGKDYSDYNTEVSDKLYDLYYEKGLKVFINSFIHFIEDDHYEKTGWESTELKKLLPKLKSLKQKPF
jgi:hypothetical protein